MVTSFMLTSETTIKCYQKEESTVPMESTLHCPEHWGQLPGLAETGPKQRHPNINKYCNYNGLYYNH